MTTSTGSYNVKTKQINNGQTTVADALARLAKGYDAYLRSVKRNSK